MLWERLQRIQPFPFAYSEIYFLKKNQPEMISLTLLQMTVLHGVRRPTVQMINNSK